MQLNWACERCGRPFGRRFSANRHVRLKHNGKGMVITYPSYLVRVSTGRSRPPQTVSSTIKGRYSMSSFDSNNSDNLSNMFQKELDKRFVQYVADKMDPIKVAERSAQNAEALLLHERYTPKSSLLGYEASVCETCLAGQVQSILSYGAPATGTRTVDLPKHMCLEKDLEAVGHLTSIQKASKIKTAWKNVEESLIRVVENWGKKRKMLLSFPRCGRC